MSNDYYGYRGLRQQSKQDGGSYSDRPTRITNEKDSKINEDFSRAVQELTERGGLERLGLDKEDVEKTIEDLRNRRENIEIERARIAEEKVSQNADPAAIRDAERNLELADDWSAIEIDALHDQALDAYRRRDINGSPFNNANPTRTPSSGLPPVGHVYNDAGIVTGRENYGRGGLGSGSPYGKGESFSSDGYSSGRSASPFTSGSDNTDTTGSSNPYSGDGGSAGQPGTGTYGTQSDRNQGTQKPTNTSSSGGGTPEDNQDDTTSTTDEANQDKPQSGSSETPTYEGNEKGWVSAQDLNRIFQLIGGGNGARGTPGGIRNDAQQPGPSVSGFGGVSNPLAPYIRTTGEEGTRRFGGPRGGKRGVDPRNIRSDDAGYGGSSRSVREVDTASFGPRDKFGGGSPIGPDPNARNPFETSGSVASKNRR